MASGPVDLYYCADGNPRFAKIAIDAGFKYGAQLPGKGTVYFPVEFADQNWKKPNRARYMELLAQHKPHMATVLDLEREDQLPEVLSWGEEAAQFVDVVLIIPKVFSIIGRIPHHIGKADVRLGYSVPTLYGGTELPLWEFEHRPVHLLGGSPKKQLRIADYLNVLSADGNAIQKAAQHGQVWRGNWKDGGIYEGEFMYQCFEESCHNVIAAWRKKGY